MSIEKSKLDFELERNIVITRLLRCQLPAMILCFTIKSHSNVVYATKLGDFQTSTE